MAARPRTAAAGGRVGGHGQARRRARGQCARRHWTCCAARPTGRGATVDDVAADLLAGRLGVRDLDDGVALTSARRTSRPPTPAASSAARTARASADGARGVAVHADRLDRHAAPPSRRRRPRRPRGPCAPRARRPPSASCTSAPDSRAAHQRPCRGVAAVGEPLAAPAQTRGLRRPQQRRPGQAEHRQRAGRRPTTASTTARACASCSTAAL